MTLHFLRDRLICLKLMGILPVFLLLLNSFGLFLQAGPAITAPQAGATLSGRIEIQGDPGPAGFASAELAFSYVGDSTGTWFPLQDLSGAASAGLLAVWDTSQLTDGDYRLRLRVFQLDGSFQEFIVEALHISNDAIPLIATQTLPAPSATPEPEEKLVTILSPTLAPQSTPEVLTSRGPLTENPAELDQRSVLSIFGRGALLVLILFSVLGLLLRLRRNSQ